MFYMAYQLFTEEVREDKILAHIMYLLVFVDILFVIDSKCWLSGFRRLVLDVHVLKQTLYHQI